MKQKAIFLFHVHLAVVRCSVMRIIIQMSGGIGRYQLQNVFSQHRCL